MMIIDVFFVCLSWKRENYHGSVDHSLRIPGLEPKRCVYLIKKLEEKNYFMFNYYILLFLGGAIAYENGKIDRLDK